MAMTSTATTNFSSTVTALVMQRLEDILAASKPHAAGDNFVRGTILKGHNQLTYTAYAKLAANTTALTEGTAPTAQQLAIAVDTVTAAQMGWTAQFTDLATAESPHNLVAVGTKLVAEQGADSIDIFVRDILAAGASVKYSNGSARSSVSAVITGALVKRSVAQLRKNNVPTFSDGFYRAIISPDQEYDLQTDTANGGWLDVHRYADSAMGANLLSGEIGRYGGVRFMISSNAKVFATAGASNVDVHSAFFFGPECYVLGDLQSLRGYFEPGGGVTDPLKQISIVGAKVMLGATLLDANGSRYIRLETAVTSL